MSTGYRPRIGHAGGVRVSSRPSSRSAPPRRERGPVLVGLVAVTALLWPLWGPAPGADAHAVVISTSPPAGSQLDDAPTEVTITFNEQVGIEGDSLTVIDADGTRVSSPATTSGTTVRAEIDLPGDGWYAVSWWVISADGHPLSGAWTFRVGEGEASAPEGLAEQALAAAQTPDLTRWSFYVSQWASILATAVLVGTLFVALLNRSLAGLTTLALGSAGTAVAASVVAAWLNGPYASVGGSPFDGPASDHHLARALLALVVGGLVWATRPRPNRPEPDRPLPARAAPLVLAAAALTLPVMAGHASTDGDLAVATVSAHLVVAGAWLGAIPAMLLHVTRRDEPAKELLARYSRAATWLLAATVVLGVGAVAVLTGGLTNATQSWGWALFAKVALLGVAVTAGAWNRWNVLPHLTRLDGPQATVALRVEAIALVAIVAASVALTHNGPPTSMYTDRGPITIDETVADGLRLNVIVDPGRVGDNELHLFVVDEAGMPVTVAEVRMMLGSEESSVPPIEQSFSNLGAGHYSGSTGDLGVAGTWQLSIEVRPDPFSLVTLDEEIEIRP